MGFNMRKLALAALLAGAPMLAFAADNGWQARVGEALGKAGSEAPGGIYRVGLPRTDLKAMLDGEFKTLAVSLSLRLWCRVAGIRCHCIMRYRGGTLASVDSEKLEQRFLQ